MRASRRIALQRRYALPADALWQRLRAFSVDWHPLVDAQQLSWDASGHRCRALRLKGGGEMREQRSFLSDSEQVLHYVATAGLDAADEYRAGLRVTASEGLGCVHWWAEIAAPEAVIDDIARGTEQVLQLALDHLADGLAADSASGLRDPTPLEQTGALPHRPQSDSDAVGEGQSAPSGWLPNVRTIAGQPALSLRDNGGSGDTALLLLHGIGGRAQDFDPQLQALAGVVRAAALDTRGYGASALGEDPVTLSRHFEDILRAREALGVERLLLGGLSYGAWIAASFAATHPEAVTGLVCSGGCLGMSEASEATRQGFLATRREPLTEGQSPADFADAVIGRLAGPAATPPQRRAMVASMASIPADAYAAALGCFCGDVPRIDLAQLRMPVLLMSGEHDPLAPPDELRAVAERIEAGVRAAGGIADVRFEVLAGAGHLCNTEAAPTYNRQLLDFAASFDQ